MEDNTILEEISGQSTMLEESSGTSGTMLEESSGTSGKMLEGTNIPSRKQAASSTIQCPVCGEKMTSYMSFCPSCSFEIHILPDDIPQALLEMEEQRVRYAKNSLLRMKDEIARLAKESDQKSQELKNVSTPLEEKISVLENQANQMRKQLDQKQEEIGVLNQQNKKLKEENAAASAAAAVANQPDAFLVMMQDDSVTALYNIFDGENTFGYASSHDKHQQIICNTPIEDKHFVVKAVSNTDPKGRKRTKFYVAPCDGRIYGAAGEANLISEEILLEKNGSFFIGDVKFTLVANKK